MEKANKPYHLVPVIGQPQDDHYKISSVLEVPGIYVIEISKPRPAKEGKKLEDYVKEQKWDKIIIDLTRSPYIDTWTLQEIMGTYTHVKDADGNVKLSGMSAKVQKLFENTSLINFFSRYKTLDEAISSYASAQDKLKQ